MKSPKLNPIDLSKCCQKKGGHGLSWHPDIRTETPYLALLSGQFYAGKFSEQWYGWNFDGWGTSGAQLDKPGTNCSMWEGLWEIVK